MTKLEIFNEIIGPVVSRINPNSLDKLQTRCLECSKGTLEMAFDMITKSPYDKIEETEITLAALSGIMIKLRR